MVDWCGVSSTRMTKLERSSELRTHLSAGGQTGQPDGRSLLAQEVSSLRLRHGACGELQYSNINKQRAADESRRRRSDAPSWKVMLVAMLVMQVYVCQMSKAIRRCCMYAYDRPAWLHAPNTHSVRNQLFAGMMA